MKRSEPKRGGKPLGRKSGLSRGDGPSRKRKPAITQHEAALSLAFWEAGVAQERCQGCGYDGPFCEVDHVLPKAVIGKVALEHGACITAAAIWDPRNARLLCGPGTPNNCHGNRHSANARPLPVDSDVWSFCAALDALTDCAPFTERLRRMYPEAAA